MSTDYQRRKAFFDDLLTIYGRKPVLEALKDESLSAFRLHLAESNKPGGTLEQIETLAARRGIETHRHDRQALSRISRNRRQDQGVALDLHCPGHQTHEAFLAASGERPFRLIALDRITNPQNLGMIIRSVAASPMDGLLLPRRGCAPLDPLVIKASAGALFRASLVRCETLADALPGFAQAGADIRRLSGEATESLSRFRPEGAAVYVLGNETDGVSEGVARLCTGSLRIPMARGVESLNVAATASIIAFRDMLTESA